MKADLVRHTVADGTYMLLCSDGLTNFVSDEGILDMVTKADEKHLDQVKLSLTVRKLIDSANTNGGGDNITAILVRF